MTTWTYISITLSDDTEITKKCYLSDYDKAGIAIASDFLCNNTKFYDIFLNNEISDYYDTIEIGDNEFIYENSYTNASDIFEYANYNYFKIIDDIDDITDIKSKVKNKYNILINNRLIIFNNVAVFKSFIVAMYWIDSSMVYQVSYDIYPIQIDGDLDVDCPRQLKYTVDLDINDIDNDSLSELINNSDYYILPLDDDILLQLFIDGYDLDDFHVPQNVMNYISKIYSSIILESYLFKNLLPIINEYI